MSEIKIAAILARNERVLSLYGSGSTYNNMTPILYDLLNSAFDIYVLLAKLTCQEAVVEAAKKYLRTIANDEVEDMPAYIYAEEALEAIEQADKGDSDDHK